MAAKKGAVASFTRPTVLDAEMSPAFIPAPLLPGGESYGYTLDLASAGIPDTFTPELLTFPIEYQAKHIKALGFIARGHALQEDQAILVSSRFVDYGIGCLGERSDWICRIDHSPHLSNDLWSRSPVVAAGLSPSRFELYDCRRYPLANSARPDRDSCRSDYRRNRRAAVCVAAEANLTTPRPGATLSFYRCRGRDLPLPRVINRFA